MLERAGGGQICSGLVLCDAQLTHHIRREKKASRTMVKSVAKTMDLLRATSKGSQPRVKT